VPFFNRQGEVKRRDSTKPDRAYARRHCAGCALLVTAAIWLFLGACGVWAAGPKGTPEKPELYYWYLNTAGPGPELGVMDARVVALAEALGDNRIEECRELARALAAEAEEPEVRRQAVEYLIETYLAEGDFAGAREAAREWPEALPRVERLEREYRRTVGELQRLVANAGDADQAARAQLATARVHEAFGCVGPAEDSYWKVVRRYPETTEAGEAIHRIADARWRRGDQAGALALCEHAMDTAPDHPLAVRACRLLCERFTPDGELSWTRMRLRLAQIATSCPGTRLAWACRYGIGVLYEREGNQASCEAEWADMLRKSPADEAAQLEVTRELVELRYSLAKKHQSRGHLKEAVRYLGLALSELEGAHRDDALSLLREWSISLGDYESARRYFLEGARQAPNREVELWRRYRAASCLFAEGRTAEAVDEYRGILHAPDVPELVAEHCRRELALCEEKDPAGRLQLLERDLDEETP